jgi:Cysteine-rich secretory protein family
MAWKIWKWMAIVAVFGLAFVPLAKGQSPDEQKLVELTNEARAQGGLKPVVWDAQLAVAARAHAQMMAQQPEISHQYAGEADLATRAGKAGAKFSVIAENIAMGTSPGQIHGAWMVSQAHHDNLMNANVNRVGVSIVPARGALFAVVDFSEGVDSMTDAQVEDAVGKAIAAKGLTLMSDASGARAYCALQDRKTSASLGLNARFLMRWQAPDIAKLPPELEKAIGGGQFKQAAVGACPAHDAGGGSGAAFTAYRVGVLLF